MDMLDTFFGQRLVEQINKDIVLQKDQAQHTNYSLLSYLLLEMEWNGYGFVFHSIHFHESLPSELKNLLIYANCSLLRIATCRQEICNF